MATILFSFSRASIVRSLCVCFIGILLGCSEEFETTAPQAHNQPKSEKSKLSSQGPQVNASEPTPDSATSAQETQNQPSKGIIGQTTAEIVNAKEALEDPNIVAQDGNIQGNNPFSQSTSAYFSIRAKASTLGMQQAVQVHKALEGRPPTLEEFKKMMKQHNVEFVKLRRYEMYGYHEDTGNILILLDKQKQAEHFKRAGVTPPEN